MVEVITSYQLAFRRNRKLRELEDTVKLIQYYDAQRNAGGAAPIT